VLPKPYRLTRSEDFKRIHNEGQSWANNRIVLVRTANNLANSRFGFSVSRKLGKAVTRNRCKRLLREVIRLHLAEIIAGWDFVFIARKGMVNAGFTSVEKSTLDVLCSASVLKVCK
jgi:ribonuclease P protein component